MRRLASFLVFATCVAGCGGGGGAAAPGPISPPPPPPPAPSQLAMTTQNAAAVGLVAMAGAEGAIQLGIAILDSLFDFADTGESSADVDCIRGTISNTLIDNDGGGTLSDGDSVEMDFVNCSLDVLGQSMSGRVTVDIGSLIVLSDLSVNGNVTARFPQALQFQEINGVGTSATGNLVLTFTASDDIENLRVETLPAGNFEVRIDDNSQIFAEQFTDLQVSRSVDKNDDYIVNFDLSADSDIAGGVFDCLTPSSLEAVLRFFPTTGMVECSGASNSSVRLVPVAIDNLATRVDPEGDGTFVDVAPPPNGSGTWNDYMEGDLVATLIDLPKIDRTQVIPTITSTSFDVSINDAVYSPSTGFLYISNDVAVVEFDPVNVQTARSVPLNGRPGPIAVSDDGSSLWIGIQDVSEMVPIDTATMTAGTPVPLGASRLSAGDRIAEDIKVAPGTTDTVVVVVQGGGEVVAYAAGTELPNIVMDFFGPNRIQFRDASTIIGIETDTSGAHAARITLDANGLTLQQLLRGYSSGSELMLGNEFAFTSAGRVIDVPNENIVGRIRFPAPTPFRDGFFVDRSAGLVYFYIDSSDILDFYDEQRLVPLGTYRISSTGNLIRILDTNENQLVLVLDTGVHLVSKALLTPTISTNPCRTTDLGGELGPNFFIQTTCTFNDAVYDDARDLIYATLPASNGPIGNSVAVISPATGIVQSTIHVGSEPTRLSMSATGSLLYVVLGESTSVAVVDLQTQALATPVKTKLLPPFFTPSIPEVVAASPVLDSELVISDGQEIDIYSAGVPSANGTLRASQVDALSYRSDGQVAWAVDLGRRFWEFGIDPVGLTALREVRDSVQSRNLKIHNDLFYDIFGAVIDPVTLMPIGTCPVVVTDAVEVDRNGQFAYYWFRAFESSLVACDLSDFTLGNQFDIPNFGGTVGEVRAFVNAGPNRLMLVGFDKLIFLDPAEVRAAP